MIGEIRAALDAILRDEIEDKVDDYLLDCRLNGWEPDADKIADIVLAVVSEAKR